MPQRALPTVIDPKQQQDVQKNTQVTLGSVITLPSTPIAPWNFAAKNQRGGVLLSWSSIVPNQGSAPSPGASKGKQVLSADGYELQRSDTGDFSSGKYISIPIRDPAQNTYFDSLGGAPQTKYYRLRATNGTGNNPYVVHGLFTGILKQISIDSNDTVTVPTTVYDTFTTDKTQARARAWKTGTQYPGQR